MALTLSQLKSWDTDHLVNAATYWTDTANRWEDTFTQVHNQAQTMGWEGQGGDALRTRTGGDLSTVSTKAALLRNAAQVARTGASDISAAKQQALYAVEDAHNAGFVVEEDLSVTDTYYYPDPAERAARQAQADALATNIYERAAKLLSAETQTSGQLTAAAGDVGAMNFPGAGKDDFDLDTQYARPAGFTTPVPEGTWEITIGVSGLVTQTGAWTIATHSNMYGCGSKGQHCKD